MAKTYEARGHALYRRYVENSHVKNLSLPHFDEWNFLFSLGRRHLDGSKMMRYFYFFEDLSPEKKLEMDSSETELQGRLQPGTLIVARGDGGPPVEYTSSDDVDFSDLIVGGAKAKLYVSGGGKKPAFAKVATLAGGLLRDFQFKMRDTEVWKIEDRLTTGISGRVQDATSGKTMKVRDPWKVPSMSGGTVRIDTFEGRNPIPHRMKQPAQRKASPGKR